jgi:hypothetical protein
MSRLFFIYIILILILGCSSKKQNINFNANDFYTEIESGIKKHNSFENDTEYFKTKKFNPVKYIFNSLEKQLKNTNHLVFLFSWVNHLPTAGTMHFQSIVYDFDNNKKYYCYNFVDNNKNIIIEETLPKDFQTANVVIKNYELNKIDYLRTLQNKFSSAEMGQDYLIQEIDLLKKTNKTLVLKSVTLDDF